MTQKQHQTKWDDVRFIHINHPSLKRRTTAAFRYEDNKKVIEFSVAECSKKDTYCKRIGRTVSFGRLTSHKDDIRVITYESLDNELGFKKVTDAVVASVLNELAEA